MRKHILPSLLILALAGGLAWAQSITRSVQMSQDPTGPIGMDASGNAYFPNKVLAAKTASPVLTSCGSSPSIVGNDTVGKFTTGSAATTCTITFTAAYTVAPACIISPQGTTPVIPTYTTTTAAIVVAVDVASTVYNYICISQG